MRRQVYHQRRRNIRSALVFVLAAVLDWAGIAHNERGYLTLTAEYLARISG